MPSSALSIERWPHVLLQWEDFAGINAGRLLERYRDRLCTFNDDIQGTAAVAAGTLLAAINVTGMPLTEQRIALFGAGSAGIGIASLLLTAMTNAGLSEAEARRHFYAVDKDGLLVEGMAGVRPAQQPFVQPRSAIANWELEHKDHISLLDVVRNAKANDADRGLGTGRRLHRGGGPRDGCRSRKAGHFSALKSHVAL